MSNNKQLKLTLEEESEKVFDTLKQFIAEPPAFRIFKAQRDCSLMFSTGEPHYFKKNTEYCFNCTNPPSDVFKAVKKNFAEYYKPYKGQNLDGKTLGVWRSGGIGDLLFIRTIFLHIKKKYPTCKIFFATRDRYHGLIKNWTDCIDGIENYPFPTDHIIKKADYHITFQGAIETCKEADTTDVYELFARVAGFNPEDVEYVVPMKLPQANPAIGLLQGSVVVQTMASSPVRTPRMRTFVNAINHITAKGLNVIISDGPTNGRRTDHLISCLDRPEMVHNLVHYSTSLVDAVNLVDAAPLVIAPDSSHCHFAGAQKTPLIALYGPFPGRLRVGHYENCTVIETPEDRQTCEFGGRECFLHNSAGCQARERCWLNIDDNAVLQAIDKTLGKE